MKIRPVLLILLITVIFSGLYAQSQHGGIWGDGEAAQQYVQWAQQAIDEGRWEDAYAGLERASDFANVSSDISYLLAVARLHDLPNGNTRIAVVEALDCALETNRWVSCSAVQAMLLKAEQFIAMRMYVGALDILDRLEENAYPPPVDLAADAAMLRLLALKGMASGSVSGYDPVQALSRFRSLVLSAMDRYPRDPRPLRIFFEYARNRKPEPSVLPAGDINLLELVLRRLPFLLEADPDLAWMASAFVRNTDDARRLVSSYRAGGLSQEQSKGFRPNPGSIAAALNLGLIDDRDAVEEFFAVSAGNERQVLDKDLIVDIFNLLRSPEGHYFFTKEMSSFSGTIFSDDDHDGYADSYTDYRSGIITEFRYDKNQSGVTDLLIAFEADGTPVKAHFSIVGRPLAASVDWERYPSVLRAQLADEIFLFRPLDFQFAPVEFIEIGGDGFSAGISYPVLLRQYLELSRRFFISSCSSMVRSSVEFDGAAEQIFLERGIPLRSVESLDGKQISVTEYERGFPVIQFVDLDLDGRMETVRRFRPPPPDFFENFDLKPLIASSESDWSGDGQFKTGEVYLEDGSVVYTWDMDGSGVMNYYETENGNQ